MSIVIQILPAALFLYVIIAAYRDDNNNTVLVVWISTLWPYFGLRRIARRGKQDLRLLKSGTPSELRSPRELGLYD